VKDELASGGGDEEEWSTITTEAKAPVDGEGMGPLEVETVSGADEPSRAPTGVWKAGQALLRTMGAVEPPVDDPLEQTPFQTLLLNTCMVIVVAGAIFSYIFWTLWDPRSSVRPSQTLVGAE
jgi:hypothetical protein